jgi:DNA repair photolyase
MNNALTYTPKFTLKNLGTHACNPAISCPGEESCLYCYVPSGPASWWAPEIRNGVMKVQDPDAWLARLRQKVKQCRNKGTAILSTTTYPFNIDLLAITFEAVFILLRAG